MCGRFLLTSPTDSIRQTFGVETHANIPARYNIAPTQPVLAVRLAETGTLEIGPKELVALEWGLVPEWAKERPSKPMINARSETAREKPSFRASVKRRRCLVPFDGWYEWKTEAGVKQPYLMRPDEDALAHAGLRSEGPWAFAGIWSLWHGPGGENWLESCAMLTEQAGRHLGRVHHRKPVILAESAWDAWLTPQDPAPMDVISGLPRLGEEMFSINRVSRRVNNVRFDDASLLVSEAATERTTPEPQQGSLF